MYKLTITNEHTGALSITIKTHRNAITQGRCAHVIESSDSPDGVLRIRDLTTSKRQDLPIGAAIVSNN